MRLREQAGVALIGVLMIIGLLIAAATAVAVRVRLETMGQAAFQTAPKNHFAAEAGINRGVAEFRNIFINGNVPTGNSGSGTGDYAVRSASLGPRAIRYQLREPGTNPVSRQLPLGMVPFGGLNSIQYNYSVASATPDLVNPAAQLRSQFEVNNIPIFQFAAFYNGTLEILPGATMALHGRVHSNANLYVDSNSSASLTIADNPPAITTVQVSAVGDLYRGRLDNGACSGTVTIDMLQDANSDGRLDPQNLLCNGGATRQVPNSEVATWLGSVQVRVPNIGLPANFSLARLSGDYWSKADLRIVLDLTQTYAAEAGVNLHAIVVQDAAGNVDAAKTALLRTFMQNNRGKIFYNDVPIGTNSVPCGTSTANSCDVASVGSAARYQPNFAGNQFVYRRADDGALDANWASTADTRGVIGDYRRGGFYNNREAKWFYLLNVDAQALLAWNRAQAAGSQLFDPNDSTDGGIVLYLSVVGAQSNGLNNYGVRVFDSSNLGFAVNVADPTGLTVSSDQAIYVEGSYNNTVPAVGNGHDHAPAAFIGDSVNILSQNWEASWTNGATTYRNDQKSRAPLASRPAASTTIYAAFLAGVDVTSAGNYNGGLENYPRFHEDWSSAAANPQPTLSYRGSFVSLSTPAHVSGAWCGTGTTCNIYNPPRRDWDYDSLFNDVAMLPPLTPRFVAVQQTVLTEDFR
ncbi:MAG: hypothetical protein ABW298_00145 [Candidatus Binatia bacterium]